MAFRDPDYVIWIDVDAGSIHHICNNRWFIRDTVRHWCNMDLPSSADHGSSRLDCGRTPTSTNWTAPCLSHCTFPRL